MILRSRHARRSMLISLVGLAFLAASFAIYVRGGGLRHGGTAFGLAYGVVAALLVLLLAAYGLRKRAYKSTLGTLDGWLQSHIYLGLLVVAVALMHSGWRFEDLLASATFWVLVAVVASGVVGARAYAGLPRRLSAVESNLTAREISDELNRLARVMARMASRRSATFVRTYERLIAGAAPGPLAGWRLLVAGGRSHTMPERRSFARALGAVPEDERPALQQLLVVWRQHREMHLRLRAQERYRKLLKAWLYLHLPLSVVLMVLLAMHVVAALYFGAGDVWGDAAPDRVAPDRVARTEG